MKKRMKRSKTLLASLLYPAIAVIIPALVLGAFMSSSLFIQQWKEEHMNTVALNLQQSADRLVSTVSQAAQNMSRLKDDASIESYVMGSGQDGAAHVRRHQNLLAVLDSFLDSHENYGDVLLFPEGKSMVGSSGRWHYHTTSLTDEDLLSRISGPQSITVRWHGICQRKDLVSDTQNTNLFNGNEWLLYGTCKYSYSYSSGLPQATAVVLMTIRHSALLDCFSQLADSFATASVLSADGEVIASTDPALLCTRAGYFDSITSGTASPSFETNDELRVFWHYIPELDWYLTRTLPQERFEAQYVPVVKIALLWGLVSIAAICLFFPLILHRRCKPLSNLSRALRRVSTGDLDVRLKSPAHAAEEVNQILETFNEMLDNLNQLLAQRERDEQEKLLLEVRNLQTQLSPHFIYNSLTAIRWQAAQEGAPQAEQMLLQMVKLLRPVYSSWRTEWTLREELTYTHDYIQLMQLRQQQEIIISIHTEEVADDAMVPRFILQPLLENCFLHGMPSSRPFSIVLTAEHTRHGILLKVIDNGRGIPQDVLCAIQKALDAVSRGESTERFIGICNVHRRLMLYYDAESGLEIESTLSEGTSITVHLGVRGRRSTQELNVLQEKKG